MPTGLFMQFEGRRRTSQGPNLTPLIDIVFLLLVFFMLTSHFVREETIAVDLPETESGEPLEGDELLQVVVDSKGRILIHDHFVELEALEATLRNELAHRKEKVIRVRGDQKATLGIAVRVLDSANKAGAKAVDIVTERK